MSEKPTYEELEQRVQELEKKLFEQKRTEEDLKHQKSRLESLIEYSSLAIVTLDKDHNIISCNRDFERLFYFTESELVGINLDGLIADQEYIEDARSYTKRTIRGKAIFGSGKRQRKDGANIDVEFTGVPVIIDGKVIGAYGIYQDISDRKQAEEDLQESEKQLRTIIEHSDELFYIQDTEHVLTYVSSNSEAILGYTPEEMKRKGIGFATDNPINLTGVKTTEKAIKTGKKQKPYLLELEKKNGMFVLLEIDESPVKDAAGKVVGISGAARDVTLQKQTEDRLIKSEQRFRDLFNAINDTIYTQELEGRFISANPAMCKAFGYKEDELIGRQASDFMKPEFAPFFKSEYLESLKKQGHHKGTAVYFKKNGDKVYLEYRSVFVQPEDGDPFISGTGRVVTERLLAERQVAKLQEQLAQAQKMESIGTLAGGIAHDFNNILFPMFGYLEMMLEDVPEDNPLRGHLAEVFNGAKRARELVKQILAFSRQTEHEMKPLKVQRVIKEVLKLIGSSLPTTIEIHHDISNACGLVMADPTQIHQITMNLCTNAFHAMEETGGKLKVALKEIELTAEDLKNPVMIPGPHVCLTVADTGLGMDQSIIAKIFEPYFTTKKDGKGTGLGLAVVHGIAKSHGGHISVYSEPGKGTVFKVYLPVIKPRETAQGIKADLPIQKGNERILLVDDQELIVDIERQMLERLGYHVTVRTGSLDALEAFRANPYKFDLVITDMTMPNMTGDKLAGEIIKIRSDIPVILCTGFSEIMPKERAATLGIKRYLMKPVVIKKLSNVIRKVMDEAKASAQE